LNPECKKTSSFINQLYIELGKTGAKKVGVSANQVKHEVVVAGKLS
jgi:hypothetical protein